MADTHESDPISAHASHLVDRPMSDSELRRRQQKPASWIDRIRGKHTFPVDEDTGFKASRSGHLFPLVDRKTGLNADIKEHLLEKFNKQQDSREASLTSSNMMERVSAIRNNNKVVAHLSKIPFFQKLWIAKMATNKSLPYSQRIHENNPIFMNTVIYDFQKIVRAHKLGIINEEPTLKANKADEVRIRGMAFMSDQRYIEIVDEVTKEKASIDRLTEEQKFVLSRNHTQTSLPELARILNIDEKEVKGLLLDRTFFEILNGLQNQSRDISKAADAIYIENPDTRKSPDHPDEYLERINKALRLRRLAAAQDHYINTVLTRPTQIKQSSSPLVLQATEPPDLTADALLQPLPAFLQRRRTGAGQPTAPPSGPDRPDELIPEIPDNPEKIPVFLRGVEIEQNRQRLAQIRTLLGFLSENGAQVIQQPEFRRIVLEMMRQNKREGNNLQEGGLEFWQNVIGQYLINVGKRGDFTDQTTSSANSDREPGDFQVDILVQRLAARDPEFINILVNTSDIDLAQDSETLNALQQEINGQDFDPANPSPLVLGLLRGVRALAHYRDQYLDRILNIPELEGNRVIGEDASRFESILEQVREQELHDYPNGTPSIEYTQTFREAIMADPIFQSILGQVQESTSLHNLELTPEQITNIAIARYLSSGISDETRVELMRRFGEPLELKEHGVLRPHEIVNLQRYNSAVLQNDPELGPDSTKERFPEDSQFERAISFLKTTPLINAPLLARQLSINIDRASEIIDQLSKRGETVANSEVIINKPIQVGGLLRGQRRVL